MRQNELKSPDLHSIKQHFEQQEVISAQDKLDPKLLDLLKYKKLMIESQMIGVSYKVKEQILQQLGKQRKIYQKLRYSLSLGPQKVEQLRKTTAQIKNLERKLSTLKNNQTIKTRYLKAIHHVLEFKRKYYMCSVEERNFLICSQWMFCFEQYKELERANRIITRYSSSILCGNRDQWLSIQQFPWFESDELKPKNKKRRVHYSQNEQQMAQKASQEYCWLDYEEFSEEKQQQQQWEEDEQQQEYEFDFEEESSQIIASKK